MPSMHVLKHCTPVYIGFDIQEFYRKNATGKTFTNPRIGLVDRPATLVDSLGRIVIWYLPNILPENMHV